MTNTTPTDLQARMEALVRAMAAEGIWKEHYLEAAAIVAELPKPIDPDVLAVREIIEAMEIFEYIEVREGRRDNHPTFQRALAAYKRIKSGRAPARFRGGI